MAERDGAPTCGACHGPLHGATDGNPSGQVAGDWRCHAANCPNGGCLHNPLLCDAVWMPIEGVVFCGRVCLDAYNSALSLQPVQLRQSAKIILRQRPNMPSLEPSYLVREREAAEARARLFQREAPAWHPRGAKAPAGDAGCSASPSEHSQAATTAQPAPGASDFERHPDQRESAPTTAGIAPDMASGNLPPTPPPEAACAPGSSSSSSAARQEAQQLGRGMRNSAAGPLAAGQGQVCHPCE